MKYILLPLAILIFCMFLTQAHNFQIMATGTSQIGTGSYSGSQILNGATSSFSTGTKYGTFSSGATNGILAVIIAMIAVGVVIGIRVLGSGISDTSVMIIYKSVTFYAIWGICSVYAVNGLNNDGLSSLPLGFGNILFFLLTLVFSLGVLQNIGFGRSGT